MLNAQRTTEQHLNSVNDDTLSNSATDQILFKHLMACLVDIAKNESNDLAVFHLNKAAEYYNQHK